MLKLNDGEVMITRFPDNTTKFDLQEGFLKETNTILWNFESMEELFTVIGLMDKLKGTKVDLFISYVKGSDTEKGRSSEEGFHLVQYLDKLGFNHITFLDPNEKTKEGVDKK